MTKAEAHAYDCEWHLDQYDWECTCGAVPNPEEIKPEWLKAPHSLGLGKRKRGATLQERFDRLTIPEPNSGCLLSSKATTGPRKISESARTAGRTAELANKIVLRVAR